MTEGVGARLLGEGEGQQQLGGPPTLEAALALVVAGHACLGFRGVAAAGCRPRPALLARARFVSAAVGLLCAACAAWSGDLCPLLLAWATWAAADSLLLLFFFLGRRTRRS